MEFIKPEAKMGKYRMWDFETFKRAVNSKREEAFRLALNYSTFQIDEVPEGLDERW